MADEQKTEQEQQPVETKVDETVETNIEEEKVYNLKQSDLEKLIQKRVGHVTKNFEKKYAGIDPEQARKLLEEKENKEIEDQKARGEFEKILK